MPVADKLSYSLGRKDQVANKVLAGKILESEDGSLLNELVELFHSDMHRRLQMDAMLTIAYVGEGNPEMLVPHVDFLLSKLFDKIDRVAWGSMIALSKVSLLVLEKMYEKLSTILNVMDTKSIVGRDHGYRILINLYCQPKYAADLLFIILEQIRKAPPNQLGQYTERLVEVVQAPHLEELSKVLQERRGELINEHHLSRLDKSLAKVLKRK